MDDENIPVEHNIFHFSPARELVEELTHKANEFVAQRLAANLPGKALLRRQASPNPRRLQTFGERMNRIGYDIDIGSSGKLQRSLCAIEDADVRKVRSRGPPCHQEVKHNAHRDHPGYGDVTRQGHAARPIFRGG